MTKLVLVPNPSMNFLLVRTYLWKVKCSRPSFFILAGYGILWNEIWSISLVQDKRVSFQSSRLLCTKHRYSDFIVLNVSMNLLWPNGFDDLLTGSVAVARAAAIIHLIVRTPKVANWQGSLWKLTIILIIYAYIYCRFDFPICVFYDFNNDANSSHLVQEEPLGNS